ncbi:MAG TPA: alpha/beta fold hydrolase [Phototrophicaceae bacterium]|nr:alpha/beta fold hydrolase [Phototrophicaceae bacterium]
MRKLLFLLACLFLFSAPVLARQSSNFQSAKCPFDLPDGETEGQTITCGYLTEPEDHYDPSGKQIQLAVAILHSTGDNPAPDPIIYLSGGPGDSALSEINDWVDYAFRADHDVILFDQRGTGYSKPALKCDSSDADDAAQQCYDKLAKTAHLTDYTTIQSADDVADIAQELGYDQYNLYSISYGTRLALSVMRNYPDNIRSVVLDSVYPPQIRDWEQEGTQEVDAFDKLFAGCAADSACDTAYPDLKKVFYQTVADLNDNPASYTNSDGEQATLSGDDLVQQIFTALYATWNIPYVPQVIYAASQGDYQPLDGLKTGDILDNGSSSHVIGKQNNDDDPTAADGDFNSITCSDEVPFDDFDKAMADAQAAPPELRDSLVASVQSMWDTCKIWRMTPEAQVESTAVTSDLPTLVLAGEYDPATPVAWSKAAADALPNSFFFEFPGLGHGTIDGGDCPMGIIQAFLADPTTQPDSSCIDKMPEPVFVTTS